MAGNVHKGDHALIAEIATQRSSLVRRSARLKNPTGAPVCFLNSAAKHSPRPRRVTHSLRSQGGEDDTIRYCAKSCRLREYTKLEEMLSRFESNGFVSQGFDKPRRAPRMQDFAECVAVLLQ